MCLTLLRKAAQQMEEDKGDYVTYHSQAQGILGCKHYQRGCRLKANCCKKFFTCRLCHDEASNHVMDRHATEEMQCMYCGAVQKVGAQCEYCGKDVAKSYYCGICKLWNDDTTKSIYHCPGCGICRIGRGLGIDFFHCDTCKACLALSLQQNHKCVDSTLHSNCPICWEKMFESRDPISLLKCGHGIHTECLQKYTQNGYYRCPSCNTTLVDESTLQQTHGVRGFLLRRAIEFLNMTPEERAAILMRYAFGILVTIMVIWWMVF